MSAIQATLNEEFHFLILEKNIMTIKIMPLEKLISENDSFQFRSKRCCYGICTEDPINSHTISKNYLYKLNNDLTKILTFQPRLLPIVNKKNSRLTKVVQDKFSTFIGFCSTHDDELFRPIDLFDGIMNKEKATLVHYRNICYGISHIRTQSLRIKHLALQNYVQDTKNISPDLNAEIVIRKFKDDSLNKRLAYCLNEHLLRKKQLEGMIKTREYGKINFIDTSGTLNNPVFCGRSTYFLHKNHNMFNYAGYSYMPWVSYMTLLTNSTNTLTFCWLESDKEHAKHFKKILKPEAFKKSIELLAYACSDALAIDESFYNKHSFTIDKVIKGLRTY